MATVNHRRAVGLMLQEAITELYNNVLPVYTVVSGWALDSIDDDLPLEEDVQYQLSEYEVITKPNISLTAALSDVKQSTGTPPEGLFYLPLTAFPVMFGVDGPLLPGEMGSQKFGVDLLIKHLTLYCKDAGTAGDDLTVDIRINGLSILTSSLTIAANSGQELLLIPSIDVLTSTEILSSDNLSVHILTNPDNSKTARVTIWVQKN